MLGELKQYVLEVFIPVCVILAMSLMVVLGGFAFVYFVLMP